MLLFLSVETVHVSVKLKSFFLCREHVVQTKKSFFSEGTAFIYEYHINLCGVDAPPAHCHSNVTKFRDSRKVSWMLSISLYKR